MENANTQDCFDVEFIYRHPSWTEGMPYIDDDGEEKEYHCEEADEDGCIYDIGTVMTSTYRKNDALAVIVCLRETGDEVDVSVNIVGRSERLEKGVFYADVNNAGGIIKAMKVAGVIEPVDGGARSGFVYYPAYRLVGYAENPAKFEYE